MSLELSEHLIRYHLPQRLATRTHMNYIYLITRTSSAFGAYKGEDALSSDGRVLSLYHSAQGLQVSHSITLPQVITKAQFNPHHPRHISLIHQNSLSYHDSRTQLTDTMLEWKGVLGMDVNPCQEFQYCISDRLGRVVFFDTRMSGQAIKTTQHSIPVVHTNGTSEVGGAREVMRRSEHSFWAGCVKYNPFHDQLVLSGGCDGIVNLHSCVSVSSANVRQVLDTPSPYDHERGGSGLSVRVDSDSEDGEGEFGKPEDGLVKTYDLHEDSVNAVCWSVNDPWVFSSLSFDGNVILNKVPTLQKYKIML